MLLIPDLIKLKQQPFVFVVFIFSIVTTATYIALLYKTGRMPWHDAKLFLDVTQFAYSQFLTSQSLPHWFPFSLFGVPSTFLVSFGVTPPFFFLAPLFYFFHIVDTRALYFTIMFFNHLIWIVGLLLLGIRLFKRQASIAFLVIAGALSVSWLAATNWNFLTYSLLPLVLYYLVFFLEQRNAFHLLLAANLFVILNLVGTTYSSVLQLYTLVAVIFAFWHRIPKWRFSPLSVIRLGLRDPYTVGLFILLCISITAYLIQALELNNGIIQLKRGDSAQTGLAAYENSLSVFLTFGHYISQLPFSEYLTGKTLHGDLTYYAGLTTFGLFIYALIFVRKPEFLAFMAAGFLLLAFSFGGAFAAAVYYLPGMSFFRGIGHAHVILRLFVMLGACYGIDHLFDWKRLSKIATWLRMVALQQIQNWRIASLTAKSMHTIAALLIIDMVGGFLYRWHQSDATTLLLAFRITVIASGIAMFAIVSFIAKQPVHLKVTASLVLIATLLLDLISFQIMVFRHATDNNEQMISYYHAQPFEYAETRSLDWQGDSNRVFSQWVRERKPIWANVNYDSIFGVFQIDLCDPYSFSEKIEKGQFSLLHISKAAYELIKARNGDISRTQVNIPRNDKWLLEALGCDGFKKLRVTNDIIFVSSHDEALSTIRRLSKTDSSVVLTTDAVSQRSTTLPVSELKVAQFTANYLQASVTVFGSSGAWLVYADSFLPGWAATVDGQKTKISEANAAFKAIWIEPGSHLIEFRYFDGIATINLYVIAALCWLVTVFIIGLVVLMLFSGLSMAKRLTLTSWL